MHGTYVDDQCMPTGCKVSGVFMRGGGGVDGILPHILGNHRAHRAHTPCAMAISPMAMPLVRDLYSLKFNLLLLNFFVPF